MTRLFRLLRSTIYLGLAMLALSSAAAPMLTNPQGQPIPVLTDFPEGAGPFPAVLLASGQRYHMDKPALRQTAHALAEQGFAVYRFDWAYYAADPQHGEPSDDLATEVAEMRTVLHAMRQDARISTGQIHLAGKSLGSLIAWRLMAGDPAIKSAWLITPLCSVPAEPGLPAYLADVDASYPGMASETRPLGFVLGDRDRLCTVRSLYALAARAGGPTRVNIISGEHSFNTGNDQATEQSIRLLGALGANFFSQQLIP